MLHDTFLYMGSGIGPNSGSGPKSGPGQNGILLSHLFVHILDLNCMFNLKYVPSQVSLSQPFFNDFLFFYYFIILVLILIV